MTRTTQFFTRRFAFLALAAAVVLGGATVSKASVTIEFSGDAVESGTGFGNVLNVLSLQASGQNTEEFGSVTWSGTQNVRTDFATNQSTTRTALELATELGISIGQTGAVTFGLVFNINETGANPDLLLRGFDLIFEDSAGNPLISIGTAGVASYVPTGAGAEAPFFESSPEAGLRLEPASGTQGVGTAGWLFEVTMDAAQATTFFALATNRIGMSVIADRSILGVDDGPENFYLARIDGLTPIVIPEPSTIAMAFTGLIALGLGGLLRRRRAASA